jgi:uncharacterized protein YabN with tetrapyrrole methylase and pyrophosphatase domain
MEPVRQGKKVVAAFYGHPGVFVNPSHKAIKIAKSEGYEAKMLPGISAEDCLYADLGIDPGKYGCQHYETSQFMFYKRIIDPSAYLVLWQPFFAGDYSHSSRSSVPEYLTVLVEILAETYPLDHEIIVYQAASNALRQAEIEKGPLKSLVQFQLTMQSTLVIPPSKPLLKNTRVMQILESKRKKEIVRLITG